ncbi:hypothetical protein RI367_004554 [Sorochytrium milnesiophthora]
MSQTVTATATLPTLKLRPPSGHARQHDDSQSDLRRLFGHANEFKEGDRAIDISANSQEDRDAARRTLGQLRVGEVSGYRFVNDEVTALLEQHVDHRVAAEIAGWTMDDLKEFLLRYTSAEQQEIEETEEQRRHVREIRRIMPGLRSEVIAGVVKLMSNDELCRVSSRIWNPVKGGTLGSRGHFGSRIQPNSSTDDPEEVLFSMLEGLSYGCGDAIFGINIVASDQANITQLERTLQDVIVTFELHDSTRHCVLAHIDDQMLVHGRHDRHRDHASSSSPSNVDLVSVGFQSIGGTEGVNSVFNISVAKLKRHMAKLRAQYFETGQGSAVTNGVSNGIDMVTCEARAHGLARFFQNSTGNWTIVNTVAGFIGPEVFKTKAQLVRACLEDLCMGKLHGLTFGLDICTTYHMGVDLEEIEEIQDEVMRAGPGFYMAVSGRNDPMLSYITTGYRDHPRLRLKHGKKVTDGMKAFFVREGILNEDGTLTERGGDTVYMYRRYRRHKGDQRSDAEIDAEAKEILTKLQRRGLDLGYGHDGNYGAPAMIRERLERGYNDAKRAVRLSLNRDLLGTWEEETGFEVHELKTEANDRDEYLTYPARGEQLAGESQELLRNVVQTQRHGSGDARATAVIMVSDGLNAGSVSADDHIVPLVQALKEQCEANNIRLLPTLLVCHNGRVRAGYQAGQTVFGARRLENGNSDDTPCIVFHAIGERPGNGQNTFSVYLTTVVQQQWTTGVNHQHTDVVANISTSALPPGRAAEQCLAFVQGRLDKLQHGDSQQQTPPGSDTDISGAVKPQNPGEVRLVPVVPHA